MSGIGSLVGSALAGQDSTVDAAPVPAGENIYHRLGVRTVINAVGTVTVLGGSLMPEEVKRAMEEASRSFVPIHELQAAVGRRLAELTGAEAAFVTAGASAALCLATCAVTAGSDPKKIDQLPDLTGMKSEIVIQKADRNPFDHAFRMVGVKLIEVETAVSEPGQEREIIGRALTRRGQLAVDADAAGHADAAAGAAFPGLGDSERAAGRDHHARCLSALYRSAATIVRSVVCRERTGASPPWRSCPKPPLASKWFGARCFAF
jgi:hypothetical protein